MNFGENFFRTGIVEGIFRCSRVGTEEPAGAEKNAAKIAGDYADGVGDAFFAENFQHGDTGRALRFTIV